MGAINPTLPVAGGLRGTQEQAEITALAAIRDVLNGNLDGTNLASQAFVPETTVFQHNGRLTSAQGTVEQAFDASGSPVAFGGSNAKIPVLVIPSTNPWLLTGRTPRLRLTCDVLCNNVDPGGVLIDVMLYPVTVGGTAGNFVYTQGASLMVQSASASRAIHIFPDPTTVAMPGAGAYSLFASVIPSALPAGCVVDIFMRLGVYYV